jgi:hypothetical protein
LWNLWRKSNLAASLPSEIFGVIRSVRTIEEALGAPLAAWMLDNCVLAFGTLIENALTEEDRIQVGDTTQSFKRYTLTQLLDNDFRMPQVPPEESDYSSFQGVEGIVFEEM